MPRRYKKKKTYRRKRRYKKRSKKLATSPAFPIGQKFRFRTRYFDQSVVLDPAAGGTSASYVFTLNGLFDPDITGAGHQPIGFDQLMPLYDHYTVIAAKVKCVFTNNDPAVATMCLIRMKDSAVTSTITEDVIENGMCKWATAGPIGSSNVKTLYLGMSTKRFFGKPIMGEKEYTGTIATNPAEQVYLHITSQPVEAHNLISTQVQVLIEYIAILTEPKQLVGS